MKITDIFEAKAVASHWTETASNRVAYLGQGLFPVTGRALRRFIGDQTQDLIQIQVNGRNFSGKKIRVAQNIFDNGGKFRRKRRFCELFVLLGVHRKTPFP